MTSMESAAIPMMATIARATKTIVTPRSLAYCAVRDCRISGVFMIQFSFIETAKTEILGGRTVFRPRRLAARSNFQGYAYLIATQVLMTAVPVPELATQS